MINLTYKWQDLETGKIGTGSFNTSHHWCFVDIQREPPRLIERIKLELINKWNRQQPLKWHYSMIE